MTIFGISFHLYGFLIALGILTGASASSWLAQRFKYPKDIIWDSLWWVVIPAIIGARFYHVVDRWSDIYSLNPISVFYIWNGGLGIIGGLLGGCIGLFSYFKLKLNKSTINNQQLTISNSFFDLLNVVIFGFPLGQAIGRLGNFVNQEVYGMPSSLPWAIFIDPEHRAKEFEHFSTFHPLFAYEALWSLLGFGVMSSAVTVSHKRSHLLWLIRRSLAGFYLVWYGIGRFFLEFLRIPEFSWRIQEVNMAQIFSIAMVMVGAALLSRHGNHHAVHSQYGR